MTIATQQIEVLVFDARPLFGLGLAAAFDPRRARVTLLSPASPEPACQGALALVALAAEAPALVARLVEAGCRVVVYGSADAPTLQGAVAAGAAGFVSDRSGVAEVRSAVEAVLLGATAMFPDHADDASALDRGFAALTRREREVLHGLLTGLRPAQIARRDFVSVITVRNQVQSVLTKLNVHSQLEAVAVARARGWTFAAA